MITSVWAKTQFSFISTVLLFGYVLIIFIFHFFIWWLPSLVKMIAKKKFIYKDNIYTTVFLKQRHSLTFHLLFSNIVQ